jgi:hypothetical protein
MPDSCVASVVSTLVVAKGGGEVTTKEAEAKEVAENQPL